MVPSSSVAGLEDALRLARGMTFKWAAIDRKDQHESNCDNDLKLILRSRMEPISGLDNVSLSCGVSLRGPCASKGSDRTG